MIRRYQINGIHFETLECGHSHPQPYEAVFSRNGARLGRRLAVNERRRCGACPAVRPCVQLELW